MSYIITIQSYIRRYIQRKAYVHIYSAIYTIQNFILHRIDNKILLDNIKYLSNFAKSKNKTLFIQNKQKKSLDLIKAQHKDKSDTLELYITKLKSTIETEQHRNCILEAQNNSITKRLQVLQDRYDTIHTLLEIERETNRMSQEENLMNRYEYTSIQLKLSNILQELEEYEKKSIDTRYTNQSLKDMNTGLCVKLGDIYLNLENAQEQLHKHKTKTVWDILFNRIQ